MLEKDIQECYIFLPSLELIVKNLRSFGMAPNIPEHPGTLWLFRPLCTRFQAASFYFFLGDVEPKSSETSALVPSFMGNGEPLHHVTPHGTMGVDCRVTAAKTQFAYIYKKISPIKWEKQVIICWNIVYKTF